MLWRRKKIGLALGGGGARGMAHIGVLRVFEEEKIPIDLIVGTSIGALVGAAFASGMNSFEIEEKVDAFLNAPEFRDSSLRSIKEIQHHKKLGLTQKIQAFFKNQFILAQAMFRAGMLQCEDFQAMIDFFLPEIRIEECKIPFRAVATDLPAGREVVLSFGPLRRAVMASCAVPAAVPPVHMEGRLLSDGGIIHLVPTTVARREGAEFIVGVSVNAEIQSDEEFHTAMDIYVRSTEIMSYHLEQCRLKEADVVIHPEVGHLHWTDFPVARDLVAEGRRATKAKLLQIRKAFPFFKRVGFWPK